MSKKGGSISRRDRSALASGGGICDASVQRLVEHTKKEVNAQFKSFYEHEKSAVNKVMTDHRLR